MIAIIAIVSCLFLAGNAQQDCNDGLQNCVTAYTMSFTTHMSDISLLCKDLSDLKKCISDSNCAQAAKDAIIRNTMGQLSAQGFKCDGDSSDSHSGSMPNVGPGGGQMGSNSQGGQGGQMFNSEFVTTNAKIQAILMKHSCPKASETCGEKYPTVPSNCEEAKSTGTKMASCVFDECPKLEGSGDEAETMNLMAKMMNLLTSCKLTADDIKSNNGQSSIHGYLFSSLLVTVLGYFLQTLLNFSE